LTFGDVTALLARSAVLICPFLICLEPTLFFGRTTAAYEAPPSAMNTATVAITLA
jgi:hypothetical protein